MSTSRYRLGVDVGGTHTDLVLLDTATGELLVEKVSSTPKNPALGVLNGVAKFIARGVAPAEIDFFAHGTTITTNALLEMRGAKVGLLITKGYRAVQEVAEPGARRQPVRLFLFQAAADRAAEPDQGNPRALATTPAACCCRSTKPRSARAARELKDAGVESIAVCYLFSFMNPAHEERTRALIHEEFPGVQVSLSSEVLPRIREWPRLSTTLLNAYLEPVMVRYIAHLNGGFDAAGVRTRQRFLMQSNGGVMPFSAAIAGGRTVHTLFSGPAAGAQASAYLAREDARRGLVTLDMGGTCADIAFIEGGAPLEVTEGVIARRQIDVPALDMTTISAGGGSIAWIDGGGFLNVGPQSAGADPGPACYGRGGTRPTVTDADLVCGYLNPDYFLGGDADARRRGSARGAPGAHRGAAEDGRPGSRRRHPAHRRHAHGRRGARVRGQARRRSLGLHAAAVRRRRRRACRRGRRGARHATHSGAAAARRVLGARPALHRRGARLHPLRAAPARRGHRRPRRGHLPAIGAQGARRARRRRHGCRATRASRASSTCATPARATSCAPRSTDCSPSG